MGHADEFLRTSVPDDGTVAALHLRDLWMVRPVSTDSLVAVMKEVEVNIANTGVVLETPDSDRWPRQDLLGRQDLTEVPDEPFIPAEEIADIILSRYPDLSVARPVTIRRIVPQRSTDGAGFVKVILSDDDYHTSLRERSHMYGVVRTELKHRTGRNFERPRVPLHAITLAYVTPESPPEVLPNIRRLFNYVLGQTLQLDPVRRNT